MINQDLEAIKRNLTTVQESIDRGGSRIITTLEAGYKQGKRRIQKTLTYAQKNASTFFTAYHAKIKQNSFRHFARLKNQLQHAWRRWKPSIDKLIQASIAISTSTSAFNMAIKIAPIIFSVLSVLATAPLISAIVPAFLLHKTAIILILSGISISVGYHKYHTLINRANLDAQIKINQEQIMQLKEEITQLKATLKKGTLHFIPHHTYYLRRKTHNSCNDKDVNIKSRIRLA